MVIPAFEEAAAVGVVVQSLRAAANWREVLVVDDGSTDETATVAAAAGARVIKHPYNKGNGASVKTGIRHASGEYILIVDADGQHTAADALRLVAFLGEYDLVVGTRAGSTQQASTARHLGNNALNWVAGYLTGRAIPDLTSGLRAARTSGLREFLHLLPNGFSTPTTTTLSFVKAGYSVHFEPITVGATTRQVENQARVRRREVSDDPAEGDHGLQPAADFPADRGRVFRARRGLRHLDDDHAPRHHRLVGAAARPRRRHFSRRTRLRADFDHALGRTSMNAAVVIATYNERENLGGLVSAILQHAGYRIIVVDDDSPDGTGALADELATAFPGRVSVIHRTGARGLGRSLVAGLQRALESGADLIFQMDADFSHDPKYLPDMAAAAADADLVLGSRYLHGVSVVNWPLHRIMLSSFANRYIRAVTGLEVSDCTTGFRCWRREALARLPLEGLISDGYAFLVEQLHLARRIGCRVREVPIIFVERREGSSKLSSSVLLESAIVPWRLRLKR